MIYPKAVFSLITGPVRVESIEYPYTHKTRQILTHLQKFSRFGFMVTWPFCFHFWLFWKLQEYTENDGIIAWAPGTEQGIYFRTPGWRWDADLGMKWTWGYFPSGHWD